jgi:dolichyl-diphosphooligosaccharide--protein glycosyltransferase
VWSSIGDFRYYGCVDDENFFSKDKVYGGGYLASSLRYAYAHALSKEKRYVAVARVNDDGHVFAFNKIKKTARAANQTDAACQRQCLEDPGFGCGCADHGCPEELPLSEGAEHKRRWTIYKISETVLAEAADKAEL